MCCACPYVCINLHTFVSIKNECLIITNFTLVNLNLSSVTCSGVSHIWTENEKVWWDKLCRPFLTIASKLLKSDIKWIFFPGHNHMTMYVSYFLYLKTCQVLLIFPKNGSWSTQKSKRAPKVHRINLAPWN